ncbi:MAG: bifunctional demethylmenaquinone methyltransferase/2-methoxy-6-polyprenyl-1,4-benzoquinol methylase UbiE [Elainellaceae cyanobacterium]
MSEFSAHSNSNIESDFYPVVDSSSGAASGGAQGAPDAEAVQALFNRIAPVYDELNDRLSFGLHRVWKQMTVSWCQPFDGAIALDICCGSGDLARLLAKQVGASGEVTGLDFARSQLDWARQNTQPLSSVAPITWVEGDATDLPFDDQQFDAITMGYGLRNVPNIPKSLQEIHRVLKPGAKAAILDFHRPSSSIVQTLQHLYLERFVVPAARQLGVESEYAYIWPSLQRFPTGRQQIRLALDVGFHSAVHYEIAGGIMGVLVVQTDLASVY